MFAERPFAAYHLYVGFSYHNDQDRPTKSETGFLDQVQLELNWQMRIQNLTIFARLRREYLRTDRRIHKHVAIGNRKALNWLTDRMVDSRH